MKMSIRRLEGVAVLALLMASLLLSGCPPQKNLARIPVDTVYEYCPATDTWTEKAPIPRPRNNVVCITYGDRIYVIGGSIFDWHSRSEVPLAFTDEYDLALDEWSTRADIINPFGPSSVFPHCSVGDKIYVTGGTDQRQTIREYDTTADTWTRKADFPDSMCENCAVIGNDIFVFDSHLWPTPPSLWKYDTLTDAWFTCAAPPATYCPGMTAVNGKLYIIGGKAGNRVTAEYDPATDTWIRKSNMPTGRPLPDIVEIGGKLYVLGGSLGYNAPSLAVEEYDPVTDQWTTRSNSIISPNTKCRSAFAINDRIYQLSETAEIAEYDPASDTWTRKAPFPPDDRTYHWSGYVEAGGKIYVVGGFFWHKK